MATQGKCMSMCPSKEINMRERERLLHPLEMLIGTENKKYPKADPYRMVKCFCRSAAGINLACSDLLRPTEVLLKTLKYLFTHVVNDTRFKITCVYDFVVDRLRSIQQDMVIQSLPPEDCIKILEPIVRFHALYSYRLCEEKILSYDPVLNKKHFLEYLKSLLVYYDEIENNFSKKISDSINSMEALTLNSQNSNSDFYTKEILHKRPIMEAIYIMMNLGDNHPLERYLRLPLKFKTKLLKLCYEASICHLTKNWIKECQIIQVLPPIVVCVGILHLPTIRRNALQIMCHAYNNKLLKYPVENIKETLLYENNSLVLNDCLHYNIKTVEGKFIYFLKDSFNNNQLTVLPCRSIFVDELLNGTNIENHILGENIH